MSHKLLLFEPENRSLPLLASSEPSLGSFLTPKPGGTKATRQQA